MTTDARPNTDKRFRSDDGRYAVRLVHLYVGWRYWAFRLPDCEDVEAGLDPEGYQSMSAAKDAIALARVAELSGRVECEIVFCGDPTPGSCKTCGVPVVSGYRKRGGATYCHDHGYLTMADQIRLESSE